MKALPAAALVLLCACQTGPAGGAADPDPTAVLVAQQAAWNAGDIEHFVELGYWRSPDLTFFSGGTITHGYDSLVERYRARYLAEGAGMGTLAFTDIEELRLGARHAVVRGRWRLDHDRGKPAGGLFTVILRRTPDGWRIVHDHTSTDEGLEPVGKTPYCGFAGGAAASSG